MLVYALSMVKDHSSSYSPKAWKTGPCSAAVQGSYLHPMPCAGFGMKTQVSVLADFALMSVTALA